MEETSNKDFFWLNHKGVDEKESSDEENHIERN